MSERAPELERLAEIMARLRGEGGCPWDREQSLESLKPFLLEEAYEVLEVMGDEDPAAHREELGDLLFQVVFQSQLRSELGHFELRDVVDVICEKLTRRHPHVFGSEQMDEPEEVAKRWDELKAAEGKGDISDVPRALPALTRAAKIGKKAAKVGFDWPDVSGPIAKLEEELSELKHALAHESQERVSDELGDVLFAAVNVARHTGNDPELILRATTERFLERFKWVRNTLRDRDVELGRDEVSLETLDALWEEAKLTRDRTR